MARDNNLADIQRAGGRLYGYIPINSGNIGAMSTPIPNNIAYIDGQNLHMDLEDSKQKIEHKKRKGSLGS